MKQTQPNERCDDRTTCRWRHASAQVSKMAALMVSLFIACVATVSQAADWRPADGPLMTRWAAAVTPDNVHAEYPRPQLVRATWQNLNGLWQYAIRPKVEDQPAQFDGQILVPFCVESALSGVMGRVGADQRLWYRRQLVLDDYQPGTRCLLHFGAVDWETTVWLNGQLLGTHKGGYDPFTLDLTDHLRDGGRGPQELVVGVWDPTDTAAQPRGKQATKPHGIWYTSVTGIWQTVWLEVVPAAYVAALKIVPDIDQGVVHVTASAVGADRGAKIRLTASLGDDRFTAMGKPDEPVRLLIDDAQLWSPEQPNLYNLIVTLTDATGTRDTVNSYFGMRKISVGKDQHGVIRLLLNNKPLFQYGPLDQGWWPDGLYTAASDAALRHDVEMTRKLGFNMARKHVKIEPDRWYYHCDKLGLLVWQDMPSGDRHAAWDPNGNHDGTEITRTPASAKQFKTELKTMIDARGNHPAIVCWVPFNEGWGQFETVAIANWIKQYDPSRLVNCASGGNDFPVGDLHDIHRYPGPAAPANEPERAAVLGEFGGLGLPMPGHLWQEKKNWGYREFANSQQLLDAYTTLLERLQPMIRAGLAAAVYTQTSDIEIEINGLTTYDRERIKMDVDRCRAASEKLWK